MADKVITIQNYMDKLGLTQDEAIQLWEDDHSNKDLPEVIALTEKAKKIKRYEQSAKPRKKAEKERKVDVQKKEILEKCGKALKNMGANITDRQTETKIMFKFKGESYTLQLTKHRKKKGG